MNKKAILALLAVSILASPALAEDYYCEVMTLQGAATVTSSDGQARALKEGMLLRAGDHIQVAEGQVDLAFDREWNNITRLWPNSDVRIRSIYPTGISLDRGDLFSKLDKLPKGTTFEVQTPTAVAAVRGTEFFTSVSDKGDTSVISFEHAVEVFNLDANGELGSRVMVEEAHKTVVTAVGEAPAPPAPAPKEEMARVNEMSSQIQMKAQEMTAEGRFAQVQSAGSVEAVMKMAEIYKAATGAEAPAKDDDQRPAGPPDSGGPGTGSTGSVSPDANMGTAMSPEQMRVMKENFVKMGGTESDFRFAQAQFPATAMDPSTMERFNTATATFIQNPDMMFKDPSMVTTAPYPGSAGTMDPMANTAAYTPPPMPTGTTYDPARMESTYMPPMNQIENQINQVTNTITTTTTTATTFNCPSGDCSGTSVTKYHADGTPCTSSNPC